jgi:hypothetical protein
MVKIIKYRLYTSSRKLFYATSLEFHFNDISSIVVTRVQFFLFFSNSYARYTYTLDSALLWEEI